MPSDRRPVIRAPGQAWRRLGELLQLRRAELGYQRRPAFTRDRDINIRLVTDIENAYRPNTFLTPTLRQVAQAYAVTYDSLVAVLREHDDELIPADPSASSVIRLPPMTDATRVGAVRPFTDPINRRLRELAAKGITNPSGAQMFGPGTDDAKAWDGIGSRMDIDDRVWFIADLQRRAAGRNSGSGEPEVTPR